MKRRPFLTHLFPQSHTSNKLPLLLVLLLPLALVLLTLLIHSPTPTCGQWFTDPCQYHPHALHQLRLRFESIIGQRAATDAIYAHLQRHLEQYEATRLHPKAVDPNEPTHLTPNKPLVLSFHGPTGTGKSLTANSIASALFFHTRSSHVHTYHGADFSDASTEGVAESIAFLKSEFAHHVRRCPLSLFIIEEIHMMAPGVLDGLRHLMDAQAPNSRFKITNNGGASAGGSNGPSSTGTGAAANGIDDVDESSAPPFSSSSSSSSSVAVNFAHVIWLLTTNIGSQQVQKVAYDAAKQGLPRESLSPTALHDMLLASLAHTEQLQLLRDSSILSALIPFFPLFKVHVKECAIVQLNFRKKYWLQQGQLASFEWDASVPAYAASQLKYSGPISIYGCKNVQEILTSVLLAPLTRQFRKIQEERDHELSETLKDTRVSKREKLWKWSWNMLEHAKQLFVTGTVWNFGKHNVTMTIEEHANEGKEEIVFVLEKPLPLPSQTPNSATALPRPVDRQEIRQPLHSTSTQFHVVPESRHPHQHGQLMDETIIGTTTPPVESGRAAPTKDEL